MLFFLPTVSSTLKCHGNVTTFCRMTFLQLSFMFICLFLLTEPGYVVTVSAMVQAAVTLLNELHSLPRRSVFSHATFPLFLSINGKIWYLYVLYIRYIYISDYLIFVKHYPAFSLHLSVVIGRGGVYTPGAAFYKTSLIDRLHNHSIKFSVRNYQ